MNEERRLDPAIAQDEHAASDGHDGHDGHARTHSSPTEGLKRVNVDRALSVYHQRVCPRLIAELEAEVARLRDKVEMDQAAPITEAGRALDAWLEWAGNRMAGIPDAGQVVAIEQQAAFWDVTVALAMRAKAASQPMLWEAGRAGTGEAGDG